MPLDHTVKAFDADIGQLRGMISQMGGLAEDAIAQAMQALARPDPALAARVRQRITELEQQRDTLDQALADLAKLEGEALARVHAHEPEGRRAAG